MAVAVHLTPEQAAILVPVLSQIQENSASGNERKSDLGRSSDLSSPRLPLASPPTPSSSRSSRESSSYDGPSPLSSPVYNTSMSESESSSNVELFSLQDLFTGKSKNTKSTDAHSFLHVSDLFCVFVQVLSKCCLTVWRSPLFCSE